MHRTDDGAHVAGRSFPDAAAAYARRADGDGVIRAPELDAVLWRSRTTAGSRRCRCWPGRARRSTACCGRRCAAHAARRLRRRAVRHRGMPDGDGRVIAFAKVHAGDGAERERRATRAVRAALGAGNAHLRVPPCSAARARRSRSRRCPAGGSTRCRRARASTASSGSAPRSPRCTACGRRPASAFGRFTPERLARAVGAIATAQPAAGRAAAELLAALLGRHADAAGPAVCLHGDANPRNALLDGDRVSLIDLEDVRGRAGSRRPRARARGAAVRARRRRARRRGGAAARPRAAARIRGARRAAAGRRRSPGTPRRRCSPAAR